MPDVPVTFTHQGKQYNGILSPVNGSGSNSTWDLMIGKRYFGRIWYSEYRKEWLSDTDFPDLKDFFVQAVTGHPK